MLAHIPKQSIAMCGESLVPANRPPPLISFKTTAAAVEERNFTHNHVFPSPSSLSIHTCMKNEECNLPKSREYNGNKAERRGEEKSRGVASRDDAGILLPREQVEQEDSTVVMRLPRDEVEQATKERGERRISSSTVLLKMARASNRGKKKLVVKKEDPAVALAGGAVCKNEADTVMSSKETEEKRGEKSLGLGLRFDLHRRFLSKKKHVQQVTTAKVMGQGPPAKVMEEDERQSGPAVPVTTVPSTPVKECVQMLWTLSRPYTNETENVNLSSTDTPTATLSSASTLEFFPRDVCITITTRSRGSPLVMAPTVTVNNPPCSDEQSRATHGGMSCMLPPSMPDSINTLAREEKDTLDNLNITNVSTDSGEDERAESHKAEVKAVVFEARITLEESPQEIELHHCKIDVGPNDDSPAAIQIMSSASSDSGSLIDEVCTRDTGVNDNSTDVFVDIVSTTGCKGEAIEIEVIKFMSYDDISKNILSACGDHNGASDTTVSSMTSMASTVVASYNTHEAKKVENALASGTEPDCVLETIEVACERSVNDMNDPSENGIMVFRKQQLENASTVENNHTFEILPSLPSSVAHGDKGTLSNKAIELDDIFEMDFEDDDSLISKSSYHNYEDDDSLISISSYNDKCKLNPCGIPQEEIMEDLHEAFEDTTAHIKSQLLRSLNFTERTIRVARELRAGCMDATCASSSRWVGENRGRSHTVSSKRIGETCRYNGNENRRRGRSRSHRILRQERKNQLNLGRRMEL